MANLVYTRNYAGGAVPFVVAEETAHSGAVGRALKDLSGRLFLEQHLRDDGSRVWTVQEQVPDGAPGNERGARPFRTVLYWTDDAGEPLPLTWRIVDRVKELEGALHTLVERMEAADRERLKKAGKELRTIGAEAAGAWEKATSPGHSAVLPRGQSLRRMRDRKRARGKNV